MANDLEQFDTEWYKIIVCKDNKDYPNGVYQVVNKHTGVVEEETPVLVRAIFTVRQLEKMISEAKVSNSPIQVDLFAGTPTNRVQ